MLHGIILVIRFSPVNLWPFFKNDLSASMSGRSPLQQVLGRPGSLSGGIVWRQMVLVIRLHTSTIADGAENAQRALFFFSLERSLK
jgi:hypothetical protein